MVFLWGGGGGAFQVGRWTLLMSSPCPSQEVRRRLAGRLGMSQDAAREEPEEVAEAAVAGGKHRDLLRASIASIVASSSRCEEWRHETAVLMMMMHGDSLSFSNLHCGLLH